CVLSCPPRVRHSFPTRRSSDLHLAGLEEGVAEVEVKRRRNCSALRQLFIRAGGFGEFALLVKSVGGVKRRRDVGCRISCAHATRSEEHTSELQSRVDLVLRLLL